MLAGPPAPVPQKKKEEASSEVVENPTATIPRAFVTDVSSHSLLMVTFAEDLFHSSWNREKLEVPSMVSSEALSTKSFLVKRQKEKMGMDYNTSRLSGVARKKQGIEVRWSTLPTFKTKADCIC